MRVDGTGLTRLVSHESGYTIDYIAPAWAPHGRHLAFGQVDWVLYQGNYYWTSATVDAIDLDNNSIFWSTFGDTDWWPDWQPTDISAPTSQVTTLPTWTNTASFTVNWSGADIGASGIASYDIQYRDGSGSWTDWLIGTTQTFAIFNGAHSHTYYFRSRARDYAYTVEAYPPGDGDTFTTVDIVPPTASAYSPPLIGATTFQVSWSGNDTVSSIASYDLQYRNGLAGAWTDWLSNVTSTSNPFNSQVGHTYFFRARARDHAGNLSTYAANGDSNTTVYRHDLTGRVLNNREQPVAVAAIQSDPLALNTAVSQHVGQFHLYYAANSVVTLTAARKDFGPLPSLLNVLVSGTLSNPIFYLPPLDNGISDSHFESGSLAAWSPRGDLTPTITSTAHTGSYAVKLGGTVPSDTLTSAPWRSTIEQTIAVSPTLDKGTLSLLYRVQAADPLSDTLTAFVIGANEALTFTLPLTKTEWAHVWFDLSAWNAPTATLRLELTTPDQDRAVGVVVDEITWGSAIVGSYPVFLPVVRR